VENGVCHPFPREGIDAVKLRVLVADDHDLVPVGLVMILGAQRDIEVVGEASTGREALTLLRRLRPDVCLFDLRMPELDGLEATPRARRTRRRRPLAIVVITTFDPRRVRP
jgi:DNA-binding NarL/FixJ family response regulator